MLPTRVLYSLLVHGYLVARFLSGSHIISQIEVIFIGLIFIPYSDIIVTRIKIGREIEKYSKKKKSNLLFFQPYTMGSLNKEQKSRVLSESKKINSLLIDFRYKKIILVTHLILLIGYLFLMV